MATVKVKFRASAVPAKEGTLFIRSVLGTEQRPTVPCANSKHTEIMRQPAAEGVLAPDEAAEIIFSDTAAVCVPHSGNSANSERSRFILLTNRYSGNRPAIQNHQKRRLPDFVGEGNFALEINPLTNETYKQKNRNMGTSDGHAGPLLSVGRSPAPSSACRTSRPARLRMALGKGDGERQHGSRFRHRLSERHELRLLHGR